MVISFKNSFCRSSNIDASVLLCTWTTTTKSGAAIARYRSIWDVYLLIGKDFAMAFLLCFFCAGLHFLPWFFLEKWIRGRNGKKGYVEILDHFRQTRLGFLWTCECHSNHYDSEVVGLGNESFGTNNNFVIIFPGNAWFISF